MCSLTTPTSPVQIIYQCFVSVFLFNLVQPIGWLCVETFKFLLTVSVPLYCLFQVSFVTHHCWKLLCCLTMVTLLDIPVLLPHRPLARTHSAPLPTSQQASATLHSSHHGLSNPHLLDAHSQQLLLLQQQVGSQNSFKLFNSLWLQVKGGGYASYRGGGIPSIDTYSQPHCDVLVHHVNVK